ncbi:predicted protein [Aspergillus terreus NIH2624]|uniref:Uncharacterized protein n=1 Tax=Aspergillus terreus (strain NIH 2624 / FGSC A1156) TaxID=341663 RepID=Q0CV43_ASPTN|nr:uncharacterized protein ATEG_02441 [Aspergillus terreus NIH2624]EAU37403.1 predicted protein [Aspergillus terreus NIH2624]
MTTESKIQSGDLITIRTNDPVNHSLPSVKLLQLQWTLLRVFAMSGVAGASDKDLDPFAGMGTGWITGVGGLVILADMKRHPTTRAETKRQSTTRRGRRKSIQYTPNNQDSLMITLADLNKYR